MPPKVASAVTIAPRSRAGMISRAKLRSNFMAPQLRPRWRAASEVSSRRAAQPMGVAMRK